MISKDYQQNKKQVLNLYEKYLEICKATDKAVDDSIQGQAEKIRNEVFNLMVLGEAKSGKSTFINAYLGKEVVPMDVRQCTSAIIKIHRGDEFALVAKTAGGGETRISGDEKIKAFLKKNAAISDTYRSIPITTINNELLIKLRGEIPNRTLESFIKEAMKDNIYNMDPKEYEALIRKYVAENASTWQTIITEMDITYPLPEAMQGITIIDSPGVAAGGNVGIIAENYIKEANAIIFVKSLNGQALESSTFMNFLRNKSTDRQKEALFLVLTGKANMSDLESGSLNNQALEMYGNDITTEKIICVDSKVQLFLNKCHELGTEEKIDAYFEELDKTGEDFAPASICWLKSKGNIEKFESMMAEKSNFSSLQYSVEKFARVANYLQLIEFLDNLAKESARYKATFEEAMAIAKKAIGNPSELEDDIKRKQQEIGAVYSKMNEGILEIRNKYIGSRLSGSAIVHVEAERLRKSYIKTLHYYCNLPEDKINNTTFSNMEKATMNAVDGTKNFRQMMAKRVIDECNEKLIEYTDDPAKISAAAYMPNFTVKDFEKINTDAKNKTSGYNSVEEGVTFKETKKVPFHHLKEHVGLVANSIQKRLDVYIIPIMENNVIDYISACLEMYSKKLSAHRQELEGEFQKLLDKKLEVEKLQEMVKVYEANIKLIDEEVAQIDGLKGDLENHVAR